MLFKIKSGIWFYRFRAAIFTIVLYLIFPIVASANIKFGYIGPITGKYSEYGIGIQRGIEISVQEYNQEAGNDLKIDIVFKDSGGDINVALNQLKEFSKDGECIVLIFPALYDSINGLYEMANRQKITLISPTPLINAYRTDSAALDNQYVFENCLTAEDETSKIANFVINDMDKKKIAIIHSDDNYETSLASTFSKQIKALGGKIIAVEKYKTGDTDFREQMLSLGGVDPTKIKEREEKKALPSEINPKGIESIYIAGSWKEAVLIIPQLIFHELRTFVIGCSKFESPYLIEYGGRSLNGVVYTTGFFSKKDSKKTKDFVKLFIEKFGREPDIFAAQAYDTACLILEIIKLGCSSRDEFKNALLRVKKFEGVTGIISFDNSIRAKRDVTLLLIDSGEVVEIE